MPYSYKEYQELLEINYTALDTIDILKYLKDPKESKYTDVAEVMFKIEKEYDNTELTTKDYPELKGEIFYFIGFTDFVDYLMARYNYDGTNRVRVEEETKYHIVNLSV